MRHSSRIAAAALLAIMTPGCDRTHPDVKLLTQTRESMTPLAIPSLATHPRVRNLQPDQSPYPDELLISRDAVILSLNDVVEDAIILEAIDFEEVDTPRRAFVLEPADKRLTSLSGIERKAPSMTLLLTPGVTAPVSTLASHARHALDQGKWDSIALTITGDTALDITPLPACSLPQDRVEDSRIVRDEQVMAMAHSEGEECEVATLHWLEDGSWRASLRGAMVSDEACLSLPERAQPGQHDELDTITCQSTNTPSVLLERLAAAHTLCDTVEVNPTGSQRAVDLGVQLAEISSLPASRHLLLTHRPAPEIPSTCP